MNKYFSFYSQQSAYHQQHLNNGIQDGRSFYLKFEDQLPDIKEHYELRSGLHQRIVLGEENGSISPLLNVDVTHRPFPKQYSNLIDLLFDISKEHTTPRCVIDLKKPLNSSALNKLAAHLSGLEICYKVDDMNKGILKFLNVGKRPAFEIMTRQNGTDKMVQQYFDERNLRIKYPNLQCIRLGCGKRHMSVPIEYCSILGDQVSATFIEFRMKNAQSISIFHNFSQLVQKTFSEKQYVEIKSFTNINPANRKEMLMHHLKLIRHNQCDTIRAFGLRVEENFMRVPARQIQPPLMEYRDRKMTKPENGAWTMNYGCDQMEVLKTSPTTFSWSILNTDKNLLGIKLKQFAKAVCKMFRFISSSICVF